MIHEILTPGLFVGHPQKPGWGVGQVQSVIGTRVTVMFADAGKQVIDTTHVDLLWGEDPDDLA